MSGKAWREGVELLGGLDTGSILTGHPSFIAHGFKRLFEQRSATALCLEVIHLTELILHYLTFYSISYYLHLLKHKPGFREDHPVQALIRSKIELFNYGDMLNVTRKLVQHFTSECDDHFTRKHVQPLGGERCTKALEQLIRIRNERAHGRLVLSDHNCGHVSRELAEALVDLLREAQAIFSLWMATPLEAASNGEYSLLLFRGAFHEPDYTTLAVPEKQGPFLKPEKVYLVDPAAPLFIELDPFWLYTHHPETGSKRLFVCHYARRNKPVCATEHIYRSSIYSEEQKTGYDRILKRLLPDYKHQRDPYKRGHSLQVSHHVVRLTIINLHGDLDTKHQLRVKKIMCDRENTAGEDVIYFDYHDAPEHPIPDDIFNLQIKDAAGADLRIIYNIHNEGFRDFKAGLGRKLDLDEEETISLSCFEPMIMNGIFLNKKDYYDFNFTEPTEVMEIYLYFPAGVRVKTLSLRYSKEDREGEEIGIHSVVKKDRQDRDYIYARLTKPPLDQTLIVSCEVEFDADLVIPEMPVKDRFYAGFFASEKLNRSGINRWVTREEEDGTIVLKPLPGRHDSSSQKGEA